MRTFAFLLISVLAFPACNAQPSNGALELRVSGGFLGPEFVVTVSESGNLSVSRTDHKAATQLVEKQLSASDQQQILLLANQSDDFGAGCNQSVPDGTTANLRGHYAGRDFDRHVSLCGVWPSGARTAALVSVINSHLPVAMHVF